MRAFELLLEYDQAKTLQNWQQKLAAAWAKEKRSPAPNEYMTQQIAFQLLPQIERIDPTPHKEYVQWLCRVYAAGTTKFEDLASRGSDALARFVKLKNKKVLQGVDKDVGRFPTLRNLEQMLSKYPEMESNQVDKGKAVEYYKDADLRVIIPEDEVAAKYYGQGTKWCTASKKNNMFDHYAKEGILYIIIPTNVHHAGEKYQFHFESGSFMDDSDTPIDLASWAKAYPQLKTIFHEQAKKNLTISLLDNPKEVYKQFEVIKENSFKYAHNLLMNNIGLTFKGLQKDYHKLEKALGMINAGWDQLQDDSFGLVSNIIFRLNVDSLQSEDAMWDNCYFACEDWVSGGPVGELASEYDGDLDTYEMVNAIAHALYKKFVPQTVEQIKQGLQQYIQ
jgi:hypothetical protein